jgi:methionyl-tRNA formyltransferase
MHLPSEERPRVLLVGQGPTAHSALAALLERFEVVGLVRSGDEEDGAVALAGTAGVAVHPAGSPRALEELVAAVRPDCVVISSYDRILGPELLARSRFLNVHYAPLPRYRGRASVNWALINGEPSTAITVHEIAPGLDAGRILFQRPVDIRDGDTVTDLYERLNAIQRTCLAEVVMSYLDGEPGTVQDEATASYGCTRVAEDGQIDWSASTVVVDRLVRALTPPYPGAFTWLNGRRLKVLQTETASDSRHWDGRVPGRVVAIDRGRGSVEVLTGDGILRLLVVERDSGGPVLAAELIRSVRITLGLRVADLLARVDELEARLRRLEAEVGGATCG